MEKRYSQVPDRRLVERCRSGDQDAWHALIDRYQRLVYSVPRRMRLSDEDCADVFQSTWQALIQSLDRIESIESLPKWLAVTASRIASRTVRISARTVQAPSDAGLTLGEVVASEESSAESNAVVAVEAELVRQCFQRLSTECQTLLGELIVKDDSSYKAATERLGMPMGAIGPTRRRCLEKLRKLLIESGFFDSSVSE
jgi:RNA polymerase sigma factor (sigma-70 family)